METRAPFIIVGAFVLAAIAAVFGFVLWLHNTSGLGARTTYHVQFNGSVPGLLVGAAVLFNGIRVGEVTELGLAPDNPRQVNATIGVDATTPVRADTKVGLDFQGLTGVPVIALEGGTQLAPSGTVPTLVADPGAGQSMTQAAREALRKVDAVLTENAEPLKATIGDLKIFAEGLARNTGKLDGIMAGVERMTGADKPVVTKVVYDLRAATDLPPGKPIKGQLAIAEPTYVVMFDTQRLLLAPGLDYPAFAGFQWSDSIPKLVQAKLIQSFENYDIAHAPLRASDALQADHQLLIDIRSFQVGGSPDLAAEVAFSAKIVSKDGKQVAAKLFRASAPLDKPEPLAALAAFNEAFGSVAKELIQWTASAL
ncbi:ABC-type transport auxiliary lipoprotein family protein [Rhodopseudomonas palustris]|uniref:Mammalian cell entry related n=1 Tax=Rhodopseudomonas palustris (strain BisB18) TaxID=316056 RepID=Q20Z69_RHOPB